MQPLGQEGGKARISGDERDHDGRKHEPGDRAQPERARRAPRRRLRCARGRTRAADAAGARRSPAQTACWWRRSATGCAPSDRCTTSTSTSTPSARAPTRRWRVNASAAVASSSATRRRHGASGASTPSATAPPERRQRHGDADAVGDLDHALGQQLEAFEHHDRRQRGERARSGRCAETRRSRRAPWQSGSARVSGTTMRRCHQRHTITSAMPSATKREHRHRDADEPVSVAQRARPSLQQLAEALEFLRQAWAASSQTNGESTLGDCSNNCLA